LSWLVGVVVDMLFLVMVAAVAAERVDFLLLLDMLLLLVQA
jgi:hypothetical protein